MTVLSLSLTMLLAAVQAGSPASNPAAAQPAGPETFDVTATATAQQGAAKGSLTVPMTIQIDRYTPEHARVLMTDALKYSGYPGFLRALRDAPRAGSLEVGGQKFVIRWARQEPGEGGREISIVTEEPVFFLGSGKADAKPTAGYELGVVLLTMKASGRGEGTMAGAARVKPRGGTSVQIDDYAQTPVKLTAVVRQSK